MDEDDAAQEGDGSEIRRYIQMAMEGDGTIGPRLELIQEQREAVKKKMAVLEKALELLEFKCWYYETARAAGTTDVPREMPLEKIPAPYREVRKRLKELPKVD